MLISAEYKAQQREMHDNIPEYGVASVAFAPIVTSLIDDLEIDSLLDYGCGKGRLSGAIKPGRALTIQQYDPGIEGIDDPPEPEQLVCCIDVLEHIEPELLDNVLDDLKRVTLEFGFFSIHTGPAVKVLPDGRNAHLIQEPYIWWLPKLKERFDIASFSHRVDGFHVVCQRLEC
jgi:hypothetical protein